MRWIVDIFLCLLWGIIVVVVGYLIFSFLVPPINDERIVIDTCIQQVEDSQNTIVVSTTYSNMTSRGFVSGFEQDDLGVSLVATVVGNSFTTNTEYLHIGTSTGGMNMNIDYNNNISTSLVSLPFPYGVVYSGYFLLSFSKPNASTHYVNAVGAQVDMSLIAGGSNQYFEIVVNLGNSIAGIVNYIDGAVGVTMNIQFVVGGTSWQGTSYPDSLENFNINAYLSDNIPPPPDWENMYNDLLIDFQNLLIDYNNLLDTVSSMQVIIDDLMIQVQSLLDYIQELITGGGVDIPVSFWEWIIGILSVITVLFDLEIFPGMTIGVAFMVVIGVPIVVWIISIVVRG